MRLIVAALLVVLVSTASIRKPLPPPGLGHGHGGAALRTGIKDVVDSMRLVEAKLRQLRAAKQQQVTERLDQLQLEAERLLSQLGQASLAGTARDAVQQLRALAAGETSADAGLVAFLADVKHILHQLGAAPQPHSLQETSTPESALDVLLDELQKLVDTYLPILAPILGIPELDALKIKKQFDKFVADTKALEHGQVPVADGLVAMIDDILEILRIAGADITFPTDPSKTPLDNALDQLDSALHWVLDNLGPLLGLSADQVAAAEQDIDKLIADIENIEHGGIDLDAGLEQVLTDILNLIKDFGGQVSRQALVETTTPESGLDRLLDELQKLVDTYLPILAPILGIPELDALKIKKQFDKFVADTKALEHGQVDVADGLVAMIDDILEILRIAGADITFPTDPSKTPFDNALDQLDSALHWVLDNLGPLLGLSADQVAAAEQDIDKLIADIENIEHGGIDLDAGLEQVLTDILNLIKDFGGQVSEISLSASTTLPSIVDIILEELKHIVDTYVPIIASLTGMTKEEAQAIITNFDKFVEDVEGMEHGTIEVADGVIDICIDILHILEAFGINVTVPSTDTPTTLDEVLFWLERALDAVLDIAGTFMGLDYDQTKQVEADMHVLVADIRALGDGQIDVDGGLEAILLDILKILGDFGIPTNEIATNATTDTPSKIDMLLEQLQKFIDTYLPVIGQLAGLTKEEIAAVTTLFDKFVKDFEDMEHGHVDTSTGLINIVTDMIEILRALGVDSQLPTDDTPTDLDTLLAELDAMMQQLLHWLGPLLGLSEEQVTAIEADMEQLIADIEAAEHGHDDIDTALERILQDIIHILADAGLITKPLHAFATSTAPSIIDQLLEELKSLVDRFLPLLGPILGLTEEQIQGFITNFDKFVADVEDLEHGRVDVSAGLINITTDLIEILKALGIDDQLPTDETPTDLDGLLAQLETLFDALLDQLGPLLGLTADQIAAAEADVDSLIKHIEDIEHGHIDVDGGLEAIIGDLINFLKDLGVLPSATNLLATTADAPTPTDEILEKLRDLLDRYLPLLGPILGLSADQVQAVTSHFDRFVADVEALEHQTVDEADGLLAMVTDLIEILRALGIDDQQPTSSTPTSLDTALELLEGALRSFLDKFGVAVFGLTDEQIAAVEQDIDQLIKHFEDIEHGQIDLDGGLEQVMQDIIHMLEDLGLLTEEMRERISVSTTQMPIETTTHKSTIDVILDELKHIVDVYLPLLGPILGLTREQTKAIKENFDKFVVDVEGMEHGTVEVADGVIDICIDILHILEAFDIDVTIPSTDGTTTLDTVLMWLEDGLNALLDVIGPFIGMDYDQVKQAEADIHTLINDIRALGDGHIDVDHGLEAILLDVLKILGDFGVPTTPHNGGVDDMLRALRRSAAELSERLPLRADTRAALAAQLARLTAHVQAASQQQTGPTSAAVQLSQQLETLARIAIGCVPAIH